MGSIDAQAGMTRFLASKTNAPGMCMQHTYQMYGYHPSVGAGAGDYGVALKGWQHSTQKHPGDYDAPAGAAVYFGVAPNRTDKNKNAGDVGISIGGGKAVFTDAFAAGKVGVLSIADRARRIGRPYLGWTSDFMGHQLVNLGSTSTAGNSGTPIDQSDKDGFLMALADAQQAQIYNANVEHGPTGDYYKTDVIIGDVRKFGDGIVARTDAANTRLDAVLAALAVLDPTKTADIEGFRKALAESEARSIAATKAAIEGSTVAIRAELVTALADVSGEIPAEAITHAVDAAFSRIFV